MVIEIPPHLSKPVGTPGSRLLEIERSKASFSVDELKVYLHGQEYLDRQSKILPILQSEPAFDKSKLHYMSRGEKYRTGLMKEKVLARISRAEGWDKADNTMAEDLLDCPAAFGLHKSMFLKTLDEQSTEEQRKLFYEPAKNFEIIGCYAQTELGHGSNVAGLETTATYNPSSQTFTLQSPGLTSAKYWIGGLGRTADKAVVMAQLLTPDGPDGALVPRGPHPFFVELRDPISRELLPGRTIMDIGPKAGYAATDNGFALFDQVELPHISLFARFSQVDKTTGRYTKPANQRLSYGTMVYIRANIVQNARMVLARSATIAIRYCAVRRQFADKDAPVLDGNKPGETAVLNYQLVQHRIFPPLVQALACHYTGRDMYRLYELNQANLAKGDVSLLADVHASSSGLKSLTTIMASNAIEECRRAMGGHGYSLAGGLASFYADYLPQVTWEGDSYMLTQQLARYLFKTARTLVGDPEAEMSVENRTSGYLKAYARHPKATAQIQFTGDLASPQFFVNAFGHRAAHLVASTLRKRDVQKKSWNSLTSDMFRMSVAHSQYVLVFNFAKAIQEDPELRARPALLRVMTTCFELFATYTMDQEAAEFLSSGYLAPAQHALVRERVLDLLADIRPQAVSLVDAFAQPDFLLNSALGRYDGNVYESLVKFAQAEPLNEVTFNTRVDEDEIEVGVERGGWKGPKL